MVRHMPDQGWICQGTGCADQAARLQRPKANPAMCRFIGFSRWLGELQMREIKSESVFVVPLVAW